MTSVVINSTNNKIIPFQVSASFDMNKNQNIRVVFKMSDYVATELYQDSRQAHMNLTLWLEFSDGVKSETSIIDCQVRCVDGEFNGSVDLKNSRTDKLMVSKWRILKINLQN